VEFAATPSLSSSVPATGSAADVCPFRFATMYYDDATGLCCDKMCCYSPDIQRWINRDPVQEDGGVNLYAYCGDDPASAVDPTKLCLTTAEW
jgi:RHS repeat-associated protein